MRDINHNNYLGFNYESSSQAHIITTDEFYLALFNLFEQEERDYSDEDIKLKISTRNNSLVCSYSFLCEFDDYGVLKEELKEWIDYDTEAYESNARFLERMFQLLGLLLLNALMFPEI